MQLLLRVMLLMVGPAVVVEGVVWGQLQAAAAAAAKQARHQV
jgi:hypothetical protein